jgi:hypothetical protein
MLNDVELSVAETAQSLHRLNDQLCGREPEPWEGLAYEHQLPWLALASRGPAKMQGMEGARLRDVAAQLWKLACAPEDADGAEQVFYQTPDDGFRLRWEAIARHLHTLIDCDELSSPEESERMWLDWYSKKANYLTVAAAGG